MQFFLPNLNLSITKSNDLLSRCIEGVFSLIIIIISSFFFYSYVISPYNSKGSSVAEIQITREIGFLIGPQFLLSISIPSQKIHKYAVVFQNYTGETVVYTTLCTIEQKNDLELSRNDSVISYCFWTNIWDHHQDFFIINCNNLNSYGLQNKSECDNVTSDSNSIYYDVFIQSSFHSFDLDRYPYIQKSIQHYDPLDFINISFVLTLNPYLIREDFGWITSNFEENYAVNYNPYNFISATPIDQKETIQITYYPLASNIVQINKIKVIQQLSEWFLIHHLLILLFSVIMRIPMQFLEKKHYLKYYLNNLDSEHLRDIFNPKTKLKSIDFIETNENGNEKKEMQEIIKIFTMKNYLLSLLKINIENTKKFNIIADKIDDFLSINIIVKKYNKNNICPEVQSYSRKDHLNKFVKIFDLFSENSYFFLDIYEKPNKKIKMIFLTFFSFLMLSVLVLFLLEIFLLKPHKDSILNTAIGENTSNKNFHYSVPFMIIMPRFFANYTRLTNAYLLNNTFFALNTSCTVSDLKKFNVTLETYQTSLCFDLFDVAGDYKILTSESKISGSVRFRNCSELPSLGINDQACTGHSPDNDQNIDISLKFITSKYLDDNEENFIQPVINTLDQNVLFNQNHRFESVLKLNHITIIRDSNLFYTDERRFEIFDCQGFYNLELGKSSSFFYYINFDCLVDEYVYKKTKVKIYDMLLKYWSLLVILRLFFNYVYIFVNNFYYKSSILKKFNKLNPEKLKLFLLGNTSKQFRKIITNDCLDSTSLIKVFNFKNYFLNNLPISQILPSKQKDHFHKFLIINEELNNFLTLENSLKWQNNSQNAESSIFSSKAAEFISKFDFIGDKFVFKFKRERKIKTVSGVFFSFLYWSLFILLVIVFGNTLLSRNFPSITTAFKGLGSTKGIIQNDMPFLIAYSRDLLPLTRLMARNETTAKYIVNYQMHNCSTEEYKVFFNSTPINDSLIYICGNVKNLVLDYGINYVMLLKCSDLPSYLDPSCKAELNKSKIFHVEFFVKHKKFGFSEENFEVSDETIHISRDSVYSDLLYGYFPFKHTIINVDDNLLFSGQKQINISNIYFPALDIGVSGLRITFTYHESIIGEYTFVYAKMFTLISQIMSMLFFCSVIMKLINKEIGMYLYLRSFLRNFAETANESTLKKILGAQKQSEYFKIMRRNFSFNNYILSRYVFFWRNKEIQKFKRLEFKLKKFISLKKFLFKSFEVDNVVELSRKIEFKSSILKEFTERNEIFPFFKSAET